MPDTPARGARLPRLASRWLLPALLFGLLATASLGLWHWQSVVQADLRENAALRDSAAHTSELRERLKLHAQFLRSLSAFASANIDPDPMLWQRYTREIEMSRNLSGLFAFAYAPAVIPEDRPRFIAATRRMSGMEAFAIHPPPEQITVTPVAFIAPDTPALKPAIGFNLLSEPTRREAIETAIASRDIALSGRVTLVTDEKTRRPGFMLIQALFRPGMPTGNVEERQRAFAGVVLNAYHTDEFLASLNLGYSSQFAVQIFDEGSNNRQSIAPPPTLIFDSAPDFKALPNTPVYHHEIDFGGRNWILHYRLRQPALAEEGFDAAQLILFSGLSGSATLALLVFYLVTHRQRAERHARHMTRELRRSEERMRLAMAGTNDGFWDQNLETGEEFMSPRLAEIFGFAADAPPDNIRAYLDCISPADIERHVAALRRHLRENAPFDIDVRIEKASGGLSWVRIRGEAIRNVAGRALRIAGSVTDINDEKDAEARLERMRRLLTTSITATPLPVFVQDEKLKLQMVNTAFCDLFKLQEDVALGLFWPDLPGLSADTRRRLLGHSERTLAAGHCEPLEFELRPEGGPRHDLIARTAQAHNPEGAPFLITTLTDVTALRQAERAIKQADRQKQAVLDAATEVAIIATDTLGLITIFNRGAEKMLGYTAEQMVGRETPQCIHLASEVDARAAELSRLLERPISGFETFVALPRQHGSEQRDWTYLRQDGKCLTVNLVVTAQRHASGEISGFLGIAIDVSEQKQAERELQLHRDHLQELVAERTLRLNQALHEAQAANLAKSEFLANMSHELRTPMHAILSFAEIGEERARAGTQDKLASYYSRIGQSAHRLLALINDLLDLSKLEAGHMALQPVPLDLPALLQHTVAHLESLIQSRHLNITFEVPTALPSVMGDAKRLSQVFHNLLANAIKFSPEGATIALILRETVLTVAPARGTTLPAIAIRFKDQGVGIPEHERHAIFEKFVQSSATKTGAGGTGLGLPISREIVHQHRGTITAENNAEGGACFTVTLPINIWTGHTEHHA